VHINILMSLPAAIIVRLSRYSSLWHIHEIVTAPRWAAALLPWLVWVFGEKVVTNSFATRQNLVNWCPFLKNKTEVVLNGIDGSRFNNPIPMGVRKLCGWGEHTILFVMIGRIQDWKGQDIFLEAAEKAASINDSLRFLIVGDSPPGQYHFTKNMLEAIHNSTAKDSIVHWAHINDVERVLAEATASIVPSKSPEPFGLVVIEAMAAGIPVIASNHGGPSEIIKDGITGILIPPNDSDSLSKAMIKLAENVGMSNEMGRNGRIEQREKYDVSRYVSQFEELYEHQFQLS
ncbi:MAG: glycosyltransferase family 4 protein, partial [Ekhidna sp.]